MTKRIVFSLILLISILLMPIWVSVLLALFGMLYFSKYWEAVVLFFISDVIFGAKEIGLLKTTLTSAFISLVALILIELLKKKLKFYRK